jgi:hypothetical protein
VGAKEIAVKKYVVRLSADERARATQRLDPQRQAFRPFVDEGPHPVEGRRVGGGRGLEQYLIMPASDTTCFQVYLDVLSRKFRKQHILLVLDDAPNHQCGMLAVPDNISRTSPSNP